MTAEAWSCQASPLAKDLEGWRRHYVQTRRHPELRFLVWHATNACTYRCRHCFVDPTNSKHDLSTADARRVFDNVARGVAPGQVRVGISGGEATLRTDLPEIVRHVVSLGFADVGLASNGFLLGRQPDRLDALVTAGLRCLNVSLDGPPAHHNRLRGHPKAYDMALAALRYAMTHHKERLDVSITVAVSNVGVLDHVVAVAEELGVSMLKVVAVQPYGRGARNRDLQLADEAFVALLQRVELLRRSFAARRSRVLATITDDGFLGSFEGVVRSGLFQCPAGVNLVGVLHDGRLIAGPQLKQKFAEEGNLLDRDFASAWRSGFQRFRRREWLRKGACRTCSQWSYCMGGSMHDRGEDGELLRCNTLRLKRVWEGWVAQRDASPGHAAGG